MQSIENFFSYLNDEIVTMSTPEKFSLLDFEQLSDSIAMTKQMLDATADEVGALDSYNREMGNYELLPGVKFLIRNRSRFDRNPIPASTPSDCGRFR